MTTARNVRLPFRPFGLDTRIRLAETNVHQNMDYMPTMLCLENLTKFIPLLNDKTYKEILTVDDAFWYGIESGSNKENPTIGECQF